MRPRRFWFRNSVQNLYSALGFWYHRCYQCWRHLSSSNVSGQYWRIEWFLKWHSDFSWNVRTRRSPDIDGLPPRPSSACYDTNVVRLGATRRTVVFHYAHPIWDIGNIWIFQPDIRKNPINLFPFVLSSVPLVPHTYLVLCFIIRMAIGMLYSTDLAQ